MQTFFEICQRAILPLLLDTFQSATESHSLHRLYIVANSYLAVFFEAPSLLKQQ